MIVYSLREFANNSHQVLPSKLFIAGLNCVFDGLLIKVHFYKNNILPSVWSIAVLFVVICVFHGVRFWRSWSYWIESNHLRHISQQIICQVQFQLRFLAFSNQSCVYFALYSRVIACIYTMAEKYTVLLIVSRNILTKMDDKIYNL